MTDAPTATVDFGPRAGTPTTLSVTVRDADGEVVDVLEMNPREVETAHMETRTVEVGALEAADGVTDV